MLHVILMEVDRDQSWTDPFLILLWSYHNMLKVVSLHVHHVLTLTFHVLTYLLHRVLLYQCK